MNIPLDIDDLVEAHELECKLAGGKDGQGVPDSDKVITGLFNDLNNPQKVSCNVVTDHDVEKRSVNGKTVIKINVRRATRHEKPVHLGSSPFSGNAYRRLHEGDRVCDDESVSCTRYF